MNLDASPTKEELRRLIGRADDRAAHHVLWVDTEGDVHLSQVPGHLGPAGFQEAHPDMRLRYETFQKGNEYVGPEAADDAEWVSDLFASLLREWLRARGGGGVRTVDLP